MSTHKSSLKYIYKIHTARLKDNKWNLTINPSEARQNDEVVSIADNEVIRFINKYNGNDYSEKDVAKIKTKIKHLKKDKTNTSNRNKIKEQYSKMDKLLFIEDYVAIIMDKNRDYDRACQNFFINGKKFYRLLATTGGAKNSTVIFVSEMVKTALDIKIDNGRNKNKELVAGKLEAYKALTCSGTIPVPSPNCSYKVSDKLPAKRMAGVIVVNDCMVPFKANVIKINDRKKYPTVKSIKNYPINLNESDGYGLILPNFSREWAKHLGKDYIPSGFVLRGSFAKGCVFCFDFLDFAENVAENYMVIDAWGDLRDIRECRLLLTTSMLKLWDSYDSYEHYMDCCEENDYTFSITKMISQKLENERSLNYQFIQSLDLSDSDIDELIEPTVREFKDILGGDWRKSLLFLKGSYLHDESFSQSDSDFAKALMIEPSMINDPFVRDKIHSMIKKRIDRAKTGVLKVRGNFSLVSGDPVSLLQSVFKKKVTGLLKSGEFYSHFWSSKGISEVAAFRAPMTCSNNTRKMKIVTSEKMKHWYQYMPCVTIFNSFDTTAEAMNGLDKDGDSILTTDSSVLLRSIEEQDAIVCVQKTAKKILVTEADLIKTNKNSFGDEIGKTTNKISSMFDVRSQFDKNSKEYDTLSYRIRCGQNYQQNAIDKTKGISYKPMPKEWCSYKANVIVVADIENEIKGDSEKEIRRKEFNMRILANKKPYFFNYIYEEEMKKYKSFVDGADKKCIRKFKKTLDELRNKKVKTDEEISFLGDVKNYAPCSLNESVMNKICWKIEKEFNRNNLFTSNVEPFDYKILTTISGSNGYSPSRYVAIKQLFNEYQNRTTQFSQLSKIERIDKEEVSSQRNIFKDEFKQKAAQLCNNAEELCNIVVELCYKKGTYQQFVWDVCGDQVILNLLKRNSYVVHYPVRNENGELDFFGEKYTMGLKQLEEDEEEYEVDFE